MITDADAAHFQSVGPKSYGPTFEFIFYVKNHHIIPIHFVVTMLFQNAVKFEQKI